MPAVTVQFDTDIFTTLRRSPDEVARDLRLGAAIHWYALGLVSQGKGAEIAGLSRGEFIDALSASGVSPIQEAIEEIRVAAGSHHDRAADAVRACSDLKVVDNLTISETIRLWDLGAGSSSAAENAQSFRWPVLWSRRSSTRAYDCQPH